jgi:hypothetical protein
MGRLAKVGHDKLLIGLARVAPSTGTTTTTMAGCEFYKRFGKCRSRKDR